jgi:hypothetical protein
MRIVIEVALTAALFQSLLAVGLSFVGKLGQGGAALVNACIQAPGVDIVLGLFSWIPWLVFGLSCGWRGVIGALIGQLIGLFGWVAVHESIYREHTDGPRIVKVINKTVGRWQNHVALWVTAVAFPGFLFIRLMEVALYPLLVLLLRFPNYDQSQWVNVSRQKFTGLVGHDLIWCLYCDWMTGVYSLGAEMLRNVESFWCPIRFYDGKKCDNCKMDFPDIANGWVDADGSMQQVAQKLETMYDNDGDRAWFGHPVRLTVKGKAQS